MKPLTDKTPKCLLPICGVPLLRIWLETCIQFGIDEVLINVHTHADAVREFLNSYPVRAKVHVVEEKELLGSAGTIIRNRDWVESADCFWIFYADVLCRMDFSAMLRLHELRRPRATIAANRVPDPRRCGILQISADGTVTDFIEKPVYPQSNLAFSGIMLGTQAMLDSIPLKQPADLGFDVLPRLTGNMVAYPVSTYLLDIGTMENYELAQRTWLSPVAGISK